jgi:hypothetical protein
MLRKGFDLDIEAQRGISSVVLQALERSLLLLR